MTSVWTRSALRAALLASAIACLLALSGGMVRIFPWLLDPSVTWRVATPFARTVAIVAVEAALAVGWPVGWALATLGFVERGEGRVLRLLGERPGRTVARLAVQGCFFALLLGAVAWASARESAEPGRILSELLDQGEVACAKAAVPRTYTVPFFDATWLCDPAELVPRLVGRGPGPLARVIFSARRAHVSGDLGNIELEDARVSVPGVSVHVDQLHIHGTAPWGHASSTRPLLRAAALSSAVALSALATVALVLAHRAKGRIAMLAIGAAGPMAALGLLRAFERFATTRSWILLLVPPLAMAGPIAVAWLGARLPGVWQTASK